MTANKDFMSLNEEEEEPTTSEEEAPAKEVSEQEETQTPEETPKVVEEPTEKIEPTRAEKRIRNLANENRQLKEQVEQFKSQPLPNYIDENEMTTDDLNKVINERALRAAELLAKSSEVQTQYQNRTKEWVKDFDQVKKENPSLDPQSQEYDPDLDETLANLLDDGHGQPRVDILVSDVLKTLSKREKATAERAKEEGKTQATETLASQQAEGAITPTSKVKDSQKYTEEELVKMQAENNRKYTDLIRKGLI